LSQRASVPVQWGVAADRCPFPLQNHCPNPANGLLPPIHPSFFLM
jgi:hypothetical protein